MATRKRDRAIALFFAVLFIASSSALTVAIILNNIEQKKQNDGATSQQASTNATNTNSENKNMLQGTKLENFTPVAKIDKLQTQDISPGTGDEVKAGDTITVDYTGALAATGVIFQSSKDSGQKFSTVIGKGQVIPGWDNAIPGMKVGGTRRLLIPSSQAYGAQSQSGIPANSDLVFDVTVYSKK